MIQVRDDWVCQPSVVTGMEYRINVTKVNNIHNRIIKRGRFSIVSVLNSCAGYVLIRTRRMRVLLSKELPILKNTLCFFHFSVHERIRYNVSCYHLTPRCKPYKYDYLLSISVISEIIEQFPPGYDKNIKLGDGLTIDFMLFTLSDVPDRQISTTIITLLRQIFSAFIVTEGLRHLLCWHLPTGNEPVVLKMGLAISICRAQGKIENEYVFVSVFMIGFACFMFGSDSTGDSEHCVVRQSSYFQPEDNSCDGH